MWNTWLFLWGLAIGVTGVLQTDLLLRYARGRLRLADTSPEARAQLRARQRVNAAIALTFGLVVGLVAGLRDLVWLDALITGVAIVVWVPTTFIALRVVRRARTAG
jgi:hypothetical protein